MQPLLSRGARPLAKHARAMSGKEIHFGTEGRALMLRGVDQLADAVSVTLGPKGRNAILDQPYGAPKITKDGAISASRGTAAPSRRRRDSSPGMMAVGGSFPILRPFGPSREMLRAGEHAVHVHGRFE